MTHLIKNIAILLFPLPLLFSACIKASPLNTDQKNITVVAYDKSTDLISINAEDTSLKLVLQKIVQQSRLEVIFDDAAEQNISITLNSLSLHKAIENILRGKNHLLQYTNSINQAPTLTSVIVLANGDSNIKNAKRINNLENEAFYQASANLTLEQSNKIDHSLERWSARLSRLSAEKRQEIENRVTKRILVQDHAKKRHEQRRAENKTKEEKHAQYLASKQAERYQHLSENEISQEQQQEQQIRNQMRNQLLQQLNQTNSN